MYLRSSKNGSKTSVWIFSFHTHNLEWWHSFQDMWTFIWYVKAFLRCQSNLRTKKRENDSQDGERLRWIVNNGIGKEELVLLFAFHDVACSVLRPMRETTCTVLLMWESAYLSCAGETAYLSFKRLLTSHARDCLPLIQETAYLSCERLPTLSCFILSIMECEFVLIMIVHAVLYHRSLCCRRGW